MDQDEYQEEDGAVEDVYYYDELADDEDSEELLDKQDRKFFRIALWSDYLSKVLLAIGILQFLGRLWQIFGRPGGIAIQDAITPLITSATNFMMIGFVFLVLQAVSEGIYVLIDIKDLVYEVNEIDPMDVEDGLENA